MKKIFALVAVVLVFAGTSCAQTPAPPDVSGLTEASMNFDQEGVAPFLAGLATSLASGFDAQQAAQLTEAIDSLPVEQKTGREYYVTFHGKAERLVVVAFKDDVDAPDLYFYTSPALAAEIDSQLAEFAVAQGW
ncbi:hypothetical protein Xmlh_18480 [Xanthomonas axonopodis pv. melhusii]|uniref:DUF3887 domain-containing protein n=1 Tax=Xanthomonas axonopodis pv. melhusii TaxID=487834 RepID=A0A1T1NU43_9XANT|nr:hypothetical protein [Xanthomonas axonopodis]OOW66917.1 hypothetical protein Xmlh_18480 [Xanthomonas axonopodis pv. melhusii]